MTYEGVTMRDESLLIENHASVRRIWLNRADAANAQTRGMLVALDEAIAAAADDDTVRVIILAGKGKHFSAGHDLKEAQEKRSDFTAQERWRYEEFHYLDYCLNIWDCPKPVVAQVQGACLAGGSCSPTWPISLSRRTMPGSGIRCCSRWVWRPPKCFSSLG